MTRIKLKGIDVLKCTIESLRFYRLQNHFIKGQNDISPYFCPKWRLYTTLGKKIHGYSLGKPFLLRKRKEEKRDEEKRKERTKGLVDFSNFRLDSQVKSDNSKHF